MNSFPAPPALKPTHVIVQTEPRPGREPFNLYASLYPEEGTVKCNRTDLFRACSPLILPFPNRRLGSGEVDRRLDEWLRQFPFEERMDTYHALRAALRIVAPDWVADSPRRLYLPSFQPESETLNCCL